MRNVLRNFIYNTGYQLLMIIVSIVTMPYLARIIGADGAGQYFYANSIACYFVIFIMLGLNNYGNRTIASVRDVPEILSKNFCELYLMQLVIGIFVSVMYVVFCVISTDENIFQWMMLIYIISSVVDINWFFFGLEQFRFIVMRNMIIKLISTVCIFIFVRDKSDLYLYVLISLFSSLLGNLVLWPALFKRIKIRKVKFSDSIQHLKPNLLLFIPVVAVSIYKYMDKIMLGKLSEMEQVGFYEYSEKIIQIPVVIVNSLGTVMLPKMSNLVANYQNDEEEEYLSISIMIVMFCSSSLCFGLMGIAREFVPLFFGNGYEPCIKLFYVLLPSCCFIAFANVIRTQYLIPHKLDTIYIKSVIWGAVINFILNFILIIRFQALGAAIATLAAEVVVCLYQMVKTKNVLSIVEFIGDSLPFLFSGILMFVIIIYVPVRMNSLFISMIVKIAIGMITFFLILTLSLQLRKEELKKIRGLLHKSK